jgi:hypothetical protein
MSVQSLRACITGTLLLSGLAAYAQSPSPEPAAGAETLPGPSSAGPGLPPVEKIAEGVYRIGAMILHKTERRFSVPGLIHRIEPPLEFLVIAKGGHKAYESMIEVDADAYLFNFGCILIGLEPVAGSQPDFHFDERPVQGPQVRLTVSWETETGSKEFAADQMLSKYGEPVDSAAWIYTGSTFADNGAYMAAQDGTLVGFIHDPGVGLNDYGAVGGNPDVVPPVGTPVTLTVSVSDR